MIEDGRVSEDPEEWPATPDFFIRLSRAMDEVHLREGFCHRRIFFSQPPIDREEDNREPKERDSDTAMLFRNQPKCVRSKKSEYWEREDRAI